MSKLEGKEKPIPKHRNGFYILKAMKIKNRV